MARAWRLLLVAGLACEGQPATVGEDIAPDAGPGTFVIREVTPSSNDVAVDTGSPIQFRFSRGVDGQSLADKLWVFGRTSGPVPGQVTVSGKDPRIATFSPMRPYAAGERVTVTIAGGVLASSGFVLPNRGFAFQFWTKSAPADLLLTEIQELSTRTDPTAATRSSCGAGADLNGDRFPDLAIANEVTADLRAFLNNADQTGTFAAFSEPTSPLTAQGASVTADFNLDGIVDLAVASPVTGTVSILLGNGDGTFAPQQLVAVGQTPQGIASLDVDGDGDWDVVTANHGDSNLSIVLNDGGGVFGDAESFDGGGDGEWALAAADMDNDGLIDLVVGAQDSEQVIVNRNNGNGTFSPQGPQSAGGDVWMLVAGDLNGDNNPDVALVSRQSNTGAILLGNGNGFLAAPDLYDNIQAGPVHSNLGDLDGDGDLDWVISSFAGEWTVFTNARTGSFARNQTIEAAQSAACSILFDAVGDGILELALIDELADTITIVDNE